MFDEIIKFFTTDHSITQSVITSSIPITSSVDYSFRYLPQIQKCKEHWEYQGMAAPINNCNICWEYYAQKYKHR